MAGLLSHITEARPDHPALSDADGVTSWGELELRVHRWVAVLRDRGLAPGDVVALVTTNRATTYELLLAALHSGIVAVPVSWRLTAPEIAYLLGDCGARVVVTEPRHEVRVAEAMDRAGVRPALFAATGHTTTAGAEPVEGLLATAPDREPANQCSGAVMLYTSATTGRPKGVHTPLFTAGAWLDRVERTTTAVAHEFGIGSDGRWLLAGPWYHAAQLFFSLFPLLRGNTLALRTRFDAMTTLTALASERITGCHLVPTQFIRLLDLPEHVRDGFDGGSLERVWHGGAACPVTVKRRMIEWWGPRIHEYYACTEAGIVTTIDSTQWLARPGSVGRPTAPTTVLVLDEQGRPCPVGTSGTVFVRRPPRLDFHYHNAPEKTRDAHRGAGTFTVGDLGRLDEAGYLYLTGRTAEVIISGGVNIYPAEIEAVLLDHPAVRDVAVVGVTDDEYGERVLAVVEQDPGCPVAEIDLPEVLDAHCRERLAGYKRPRHYRAVPRLPREPTGKLDRRSVRALVEGIPA